MEAKGPIPFDLPDGIVEEMAQGWTESEEQELFEGIRFYLKRMDIKNPDQWHEMIRKVSCFLSLSLGSKSNEELIRWKLRQMCDLYRHFKLFIFKQPGVSFNLHTNTARVGPLYWRCTQQESEVYAFFRIHGFRQYNNCWYVFDKNELGQYASYVDEAVHMKIPVGADPQYLEGFYYFRNRARLPFINKKQRAMRYKDSKVTDEDMDLYFFTGGWDPTDEDDFITKVEELVKDRNINSQEKYDILVDDLVKYYDDPEDIKVSVAGIREKLRSVAYVYGLFKRFLFHTVGVEYNFFDWFSRVDDTYWKNEGKEPMYKGFFRYGGFGLYQTWYYVMEVKGLERFARGRHPIDADIPEGADLSFMLDENVFKSYYKG